MRLLPPIMRREEPHETNRPRCSERAPIAAIECAACGWELHDPCTTRSPVAQRD